MDYNRHKLDLEAKGVKMRLDIPDDKAIRYSVAFAIAAFGFLICATGVALVLSVI